MRAGALLAAAALAAAAGAAGLKPSMDPVVTDAQRHARSLLEQSRVLDEVLSVTREELRLPRDVHLRIGGDDGPLYDPETASIIIPYFFVSDVAERLARTATDLSPQARDEVVVGVVEHTLYHELGHALVDLLDLPLTQKEEDAVDTLATVLMVESFEEGEHAALDAMEDFLALDRLEGAEASPGYFAEHSIDSVRYESGICLAYGSSPAASPEVGEELGPARARACITRWERERSAWFRRLRPVLRPDGEFARGL